MSKVREAGEEETEEEETGELSITAGMDAYGHDGDESGIPVSADQSDSTETTQPAAGQIPPLSKNQIKKQKKKERWLQIKAEKRQAEKEKRKKRFAEMRERGEDIGPSRKSLKKNRMADSACQQRVVIDCSFDTYMTEKDTTFLVQQIQHSYAANRRADNPLQLHICGIGGKAKQRLDSIGDYRGWDIHKEERDFTEVFPKEEIVYLSSESPNVLGDLDEDKVYIIGGLVDHNHHKGLCHRLAEERGLAHAQLPIGQFLQLKSRKVLTINHVFEILLRFTETKNWQTSLLTVLPQRKGVCVKTEADKTDPTEAQDTHKLHPQNEEDLQPGASEMPVSILNGSTEFSASGCVTPCVDHVSSATEDKASTDSTVEECGSSAVDCHTKSCTDVTVSDGDIGKDV